MGYDEPGSGREWAAAGVVVLLAMLAGGAWLYMMAMQILQGQEVGPDADEMAKDPLLHIEIEGATAGDVLAFTGTEGGLMASPANETSRTSRTWESDTTDWQTLLLAAMDAADDYSVTWSRLICSDSSVRFGGNKNVLVDGDTVAAGVTVEVSGINAAAAPLRLTIRLTSSGHPPTQPPGPAASENGCPPQLNDKLAELQH